MGQSLKKKMAEVSELPKDVVMGMPVLTMTGQQELCIENYRGMIEYTDSVVRIQTKAGLIKVTGKGLQVAYYTNDEMMNPWADHGGLSINIDRKESIKCC